MLILSLKHQCLVSVKHETSWDKLYTGRTQTEKMEKTGVLQLKATGRWSPYASRGMDGVESMSGGIF